MPSDRVQELFYEAQQLEEIADSYGGDPARYRVADQAWDRAFKAAEREGGAQLLEELAAEYGFSTPASREARQSLGLPDTHQGVPTYDPYKSARQEAPTCDFCTADGAADVALSVRGLQQRHEAGRPQWVRRLPNDAGRASW